MEHLLLNALRIAACSVILSLSACTHLFFYPEKQHFASPDEGGLAYEDVWLDSLDGTRLHAWFLPARDTAKGTILHLHGNAENISTHIASVYWLPERGYNVLLLDYRGYGKSEGSPTLAGLHDDAEAALRYLAKTESNIIVFGQSLGGAVAIEAVASSAVKDSIRALIIESAFSDYREIFAEKLEVLWLTSIMAPILRHAVDDQFKPARSIANISPIPLVVIHGDQDIIVPMHHGRVLYEKAKCPKQFWHVRDGTHISAFQRTAFRELLEINLNKLERYRPEQGEQDAAHGNDCVPAGRHQTVGREPHVLSRHIATSGSISTDWKLP